MSYSLSEAAKATGRNKTTIQRAIKAGKISATTNADGTYSIDPAELHRVFPVAQGYTPTVASQRNATLQREPVTLATLEERVRSLEQQLRNTEDERDRWQHEADRWHDQAERLTMLLTSSQSAPVAQQPVDDQVVAPATRSWWQKLIGR